MLFIVMRRIRWKINPGESTYWGLLIKDLSCSRQAVHYSFPSNIALTLLGGITHNGTGDV